jgi:hypothetical protein
MLTNKRRRDQLDATIVDLLKFNIINISSTCFGRLYAHHQESRADCMLLPMVLCSGCSSVGSGELGGEMCSLLRGVRQHPLNSEHISPSNSPEPTQPQPEHNTIGSNMQSALFS